MKQCNHNQNTISTLMWNTNISKRLMLIQPTSRGHIEFSIIGREVEVAKIVGISLEIVNERVRVLTRRKEVGRTGIVLSINLKEGEVFEEVLRRVAGSNPIVGRRNRGRRWKRKVINYLSRASLVLEGAEKSWYRNLKQFFLFSLWDG